MQHPGHLPASQHLTTAVANTRTFSYLFLN